MKKLFLLFLLFILTECSLPKPKKATSALLIDPQLQKSLQSYLNLPFYARQDHDLSILNDIAHGDGNIINRINGEVTNVLQSLVTESIFKSFTEEPAFIKQTMRINQESYRLNIFTHLENTIEIVRINHINSDYTIIYKKYRIDSQCEPPIISGKPLEKACFILFEKRSQAFSEKNGKNCKRLLTKRNFGQFLLHIFLKVVLMVVIGR